MSEENNKSEKKSPFLIILFLIIFLLSNIYSSASSKSIVVNPKNFIRRKGNKLIVGKKDQIIWLRGINLSAYLYHMWEGKPHINYEDHNENDFKKISDMGMNVVRLMLSAGIIENEDKPFTYRKEGWEWIDRNIKWAKKYNVYLILDMHVSPGTDRSGNGKFWYSNKNQKQLKALWKAIAARYQNETIVAGYDIYNEPTPLTPEQWRNMAQDLVDTIREVDTNHLIIVPALHSCEKAITKDYYNFLVKDKKGNDNIMYTFHTYYPMEYTYQDTDFTGMGDGGSYPDKNILQFPSNLIWKSYTWKNPKLRPGNTEWKYYKGEKFKIKDPAIKLGTVRLDGDKNRGTVYFDDFKVKEYNQYKKFVRNVFSVKIDSRAKVARDRWYYFPENKAEMFKKSQQEGRKDQYSLVIQGKKENAHWFNNKLYFQVKPGYYYQISGWMKGKDISPESSCKMRLDFFALPEGGFVGTRNKNTLEYDLLRFLKFGMDNNVPMFVGEFGVYQKCFKNNKGGENWVKDMVDLMIKHKVNFTYYAYHDGIFGIYLNPEGLPDEKMKNNILAEVLAKSLKSQRKTPAK